jgi:hypothetical protein
MNPHEIPDTSADPAVNQRRLRWGLGLFLGHGHAGHGCC